VEGKNVLIIDDIADTGGSIQRAEEYVEDRDAGAVRTATLQLLGTSEFQPDFVGERLEQWTWVVYPWNFLEDMVDLTEGAMERADESAFAREDLRHYLEEYHGIGRIEMEVAQPGRLDEVIEEMVRRDVAVPVGDETWALAE
jgi:hypoxanthine phosphoribosyltransferase